MKRGSFRKYGLKQKPLKRSTKVLKAGKKVKAWNAIRRQLKADSERNGGTTCELRGVIPHDCTYDNLLGYAHAAKRRKLSPEDLSHAILICQAAHQIIERWSPEDMKWIVDETIERRAQCESIARHAARQQTA